MSAIKNKLAAFRKWEYSALSVVLLLNLVIGALTVEACGISTDEPDNWAYADWALAQYRGGNPESYFDPGHGPGFLIVARLGVAGLQQLFPGWELVSAWHFVYFLFFQLSALFVYQVARRFVGRGAAIFATLLYLSQPLLRGHAFMNPKDGPFLVLFWGAISLALKLIDGLKAGRTPETETASWREEAADFLGRTRSRSSRIGSAGLLALILFLSLEVAGAGLAQAGIEGVIRYLYEADEVSVAGRLFSAVASNADQVGLASYVSKYTGLYEKVFGRLNLLLLAAALGLGLRWAFPQKARALAGRAKQVAKQPEFFPAVILMGLAWATRTIGIVGLGAVGAYWALSWRKKWMGAFLVYTGAVLAVALLAWPNLWDNPVGNLGSYLANITGFENWDGAILFEGESYNKDNYPFYMAPKLIGLQLTEPALLLAGMGAALAIYRARKRVYDPLLVLFVLGYFLGPLLLAMLVRPVIYNGFRHLLFVLPPLFVAAGIGFEYLAGKIRSKVMVVALAAALLLPGLAGIGRLFPYEYIYYNAFAGGVSGAFREYELDYWQLSYKEAMEYLNEEAAPEARVMVYTGADLVEEIMREDLRVAHEYLKNLRADQFDYIVISSNVDLDIQLEQQLDNLREIHAIRREGAPLSKIYEVLGD